MSFRLVLVAALLGITSACVVRVRNPPPPAPAEVQTVRPANGHHVWVPGHHEYRGGRYVWVPGHWKKSQPGKHWVPGHWKKTPRGNVWVKGHWR